MIDDLLWAELCEAQGAMGSRRNRVGRADRAAFEAIARLAVEGGRWLQPCTEHGRSQSRAPVASWRRFGAWVEAGTWPVLWRVLNNGLRERGYHLATPVSGDALTDMLAAAIPNQSTIVPSVGASEMPPQK
jgi:transposase